MVDRHVWMQAPCEALQLRVAGGVSGFDQGFDTVKDRL